MSQITDWETFHDTFAQALGFPGFYGRNMDAWIDCLTSADEKTHGMLRTTVPAARMDLTNASAVIFGTLAPRRGDLGHGRRRRPTRCCSRREQQPKPDR